MKPGERIELTVDHDDGGRLFRAGQRGTIVEPSRYNCIVEFDGYEPQKATAKATPAPALTRPWVAAIPYAKLSNIQ